MVPGKGTILPGKPTSPDGSDGKESACKAGDLGSIPGEGSGYPLHYSCLGDLGSIPGEGSGYPLHYSCLGELHGQRSLAGYSPWQLKELDMTEQLMHSTGSVVKESACQCRRCGFRR